jgi:hypothetical protein
MAGSTLRWEALQGVIAGEVVMPGSPAYEELGRRCHRKPGGRPKAAPSTAAHPMPRRTAWQRRASADRTVTSFRFGRATDKPILCDWDGDGDRTPGVFRDGRWYIRNSNTGGPAQKTFSFARAGDIPVCGRWPNYRGEARGEHPGVYRAGVWYLRYSLTTGPADHTLRFGDAGSKPVVGDWNGDVYDQPGIFREGRWQLVDTFWAEVDPDDGKRFAYGRAGDVPVVGRLEPRQRGDGRRTAWQDLVCVERPRRGDIVVLPLRLLDRPARGLALTAPASPPGVLGACPSRAVSRPFTAGGGS